jgi:PAS domain-containing protein
MEYQAQPFEEILGLELEISEHHVAEIDARRTIASASASALLEEALAESRTLIRHLRAARSELGRRSQVLREATVRLDTAKLRYEELLRTSPTPYLVTDAAARILEANDAASNLLHRLSDQVVERSLFAFVPPEDRERLLAALAAALGAGEDRWCWDIRVGPIPQIALPAAAVCVVVRRSSGHVDHLRWALCDVSPLRRSEAAAEAFGRERRARLSAESAALRFRLLADFDRLLREPDAARSPLSAVHIALIPRFADACVIHLVDALGLPEPLHAGGLTVRSLSDVPSRHPVLRVLASRRAAVIGDAAAAFHAASDGAAARVAADAFALVIPLTVGPTPLGTVTALRWGRRLAYDAEDLSFAELLASRLSAQLAAASVRGNRALQSS